MVTEHTEDKFVLRKKPVELILIILPYPIAAVILSYMTIEAVVFGRGSDDLLGLLFSWALLTGLTFALLRCMFVVTLTLDRAVGTAAYRRANLFSATERIIPLTELLRLEVERGTDSDNDPTYRLIIRLIDGEIIPFTKST